MNVVVMMRRFSRSLLDWCKLGQACFSSRFFEGTLHASFYGSIGIFEEGLFGVAAGCEEN